MRHILIALATSSLLALVGCGSDDASPVQPAAPSPVTGSFGAAAIGQWKADTAIVVTSVGLPSASAVLTIHDTLRSDSTFSASVYLENLAVSGNPLGSVTGALYTRRGEWFVLGDSAIVLAPQNCMQSDTATITIFKPISLPFRTDASNNFIANPLKDVVCGAPDTVRTRPLTNGHWAVPMKVNMTGLASGSWVLDFERLP